MGRSAGRHTARPLLALRLPLVLALALAGCSFDSAGLPPGGPDPDATAPRDGDRPLDQRGDLSPPDGPAKPDAKPAPDAQPKDVKPPPDTKPACGPSTCAGCCTANTCRTGDEVDACGTAGAVCVDCWVGQKICGGGGTCTGCASNTQCPGDTICTNPGASSGECGAAYGRSWKVVAVSATINSSKTYDQMSLPDPWAEIDVGGKKGNTNVTYDTNAPYWNQFVENTLTKTTPVSVNVWDKDIAGDDWIGKVEFPAGVPIAILKAGDYTATGAPADGLHALKLSFQPAP